MNVKPVSIRHRFAVAAMTFVIAAVAVSCGGSAPLDGTVRIAGSTTLLPMISKISADFAAQSPLVALNIGMTGSSDGAVLFCDALVPIAGTSRPFNEREVAGCAASDIAYTRLLVARDAVALLVDKADSTVNCLTQEQIYSLVGPESVGVDTWDAAGAVVPGAGGGLPSLPLSVVGPGMSSGTRQTLIDLAIAPIAKTRGVGPALRPDYNAMPAEQLIRSAVISRPGALGFAGLATANGWSDSLRMVAVDFGNGCAAPSIAAINAGEYPLSRELYVYVNLDEVAKNPTEVAFVDYLLSPQGLRVAGEVGGVALTTTEAEGMRKHWQDALTLHKADSA